MKHLPRKAIASTARTSIGTDPEDEGAACIKGARSQWESGALIAVPITSAGRFFSPLGPFRLIVPISNGEACSGS
jgi:hypothetical protein